MRTPPKPCSASSWGMSGCSATSGASAPVNSSSSRPSPSGSSKRRPPSLRVAAAPSSPSRCSQKSRACCDPTRHTIELTIPRPARPARAPGYSKNVMSEPALPRSSA